MKTFPIQTQDPAHEWAPPAPAAYPAPSALLRELDMNTLFAQTVLDQDGMGQVFAAPAASPRAGYVVHRYGMSLLFGDPGSPEWAAHLVGRVLARPRTADEWMQVSSDTWVAPVAPLESAVAAPRERTWRGTRA